MRRSAVIVNRVHQLDPGEPDRLATKARLAGSLGAALANKVVRTHADVQRLARRDRATVERLRAVLHHDPVCLLDRETDVDDIGGLVDLEREPFVSSAHDRAAGRRGVGCVVARSGSAFDHGSLAAGDLQVWSSTCMRCFSL